VFCEIVAGRMPSHLVWEDAHSLALLDHAPLAPGHVLVLPRQHIQTLGDLPTSEVGPYFEAVRRLSIAVERGLGADGAFVAINIRISQSVPHLHTHVVPRRTGDGLFGRTFQWIRRPYPTEAAITDAPPAIQAALAAVDTSSTEPR
jgi:histidine triad (HIT) family protein